MSKSLIKDISLLLIGNILGGCAVFFFMPNSQSSSKNISSDTECSQTTCHATTESDMASQQKQDEVYNDLKNEEPKEEFSEAPIQQPMNNNYQSKDSHLRYPLLLGEVFSGPERIRVMKALYKKLDGEYMQCSSFEYFCYVFGNIGNNKFYKPTDDDFINWQDGKPSLQWLILKLYKPEGKKQLERGTWSTVEKCFLLDNKPIPPRSMKLATNHIGDAHKNRIDALIADIMQLGPSCNPIHAETFSQYHQV